MNGEQVIPLTPTMEAKLLLQDALEVTAEELAVELAGLNFMVGRSVAPNKAACTRIAAVLVRKFGGMIRRAIEGDRAVALLTESADRERRLREALAPFAKAGELFDGVLEIEGQGIYLPAAGKEYAIGANDLRRARATLAALAPL